MSSAAAADLTELKGELHGGERRARKALRRLLENGAAGGHDLAVLLPDALPLGESADPEARRLLGLFVEVRGRVWQGGALARRRRPGSAPLSPRPPAFPLPPPGGAPAKSKPSPRR